MQESSGMNFSERIGTITGSDLIHLQLQRLKALLGSSGKVQLTGRSAAPEYLQEAFKKEEILDEFLYACQSLL